MPLKSKTSKTFKNFLKFTTEWRELWLFAYLAAINIFFRTYLIFPIRPYDFYHWRVPFRGIMLDIVDAGLFYLLFSLLFRLLFNYWVKFTILCTFTVFWSLLNYTNFEFALNHNQLLPLSWFKEAANYRQDAENLDIIFLGFLNFKFALTVGVPVLLCVLLLFYAPDAFSGMRLKNLLAAIAIGSIVNAVVNDPSIQAQSYIPTTGSMLRYWHSSPDSIYQGAAKATVSKIDGITRQVLFEKPGKRILPEVKTADPNVVFIHLESFRAFEVGAYGAPFGATPVFDRYASQGALFKEIYTLFFLTKAGQFGVLCGGQNNFGGFAMTEYPNHSTKCVSDFLAEQGYEGWWFHGQSGVYDNQGYFFNKHGFKHLKDRLSFPAGAEVLGWGLSDKELMKHALTHLNVMKEPFMLYLQSQTNHAPFEAPPEFQKKRGLDAESEKIVNTIEYTDAMLGVFLDNFLKTEKGKRSLIVIFADHGLRRPLPIEPSQPEATIVSTSRVPLLILYPEAEREGTKLVSNDVGSLADLAPTIMDILGITYDYPVLAKSLAREYSQRFAQLETPERWLMRGDRLIFDKGPVMLKTGEPTEENLGDMQWRTFMGELPLIQNWLMNLTTSNEAAASMRSFGWEPLSNLSEEKPKE